MTFQSHAISPDKVEWSTGKITATSSRRAVSDALQSVQAGYDPCSPLSWLDEQTLIELLHSMWRKGGWRDCTTCGQWGRADQPCDECTRLDDLATDAVAERVMNHGSAS